MITSRSQLLFSVAAVRRMCGLATGIKVRIQIWWKVIWVWIEGHRPTLVSKKLFLAHFAEWRKAQARSLQVTQWLDRGSRFTVHNESKHSTHVVDCELSGPICTCEDYHNQMQFLNKGCCKHGYAVLAHLGFSSLQHYLAALDNSGYLRSKTG
jgi:hypothetical protein